MAFSETAEQFRAAALRHLGDARRLLGPEPADWCDCGTCGAHRVGAVYLAGYAVECMLKAVALGRLGRTYWDEAVRDLRAAGIDVRGGHHLRRLVLAADVDPTREQGLSESLSLLVGVWKPDLRYHGGTVCSDAQARGYVTCAEVLCRWLRAQA
jgi:hypothetical protein